MHIITKKLQTILELDLLIAQKIKKICQEIATFYDLYYVCLLIYDKETSKLYVCGTNLSQEFDKRAIGMDFGIYTKWEDNLVATAFRTQTIKTKIVDMPSPLLPYSQSELTIPITCNSPVGVLRIISKSKGQFSLTMIQSLENCLNTIQPFVCTLVNT